MKSKDSGLVISRKQEIIYTLIAGLIIFSFVGVFSFMFAKIIYLGQLKYINNISDSQFVLGADLAAFMLPGIIIAICLVLIFSLNLREDIKERLKFFGNRFSEFIDYYLSENNKIKVFKTFLLIFSFLVIILSIFTTFLVFDSYVIVTDAGILYNPFSSLFHSKLYKWDNISSIKPFASSYEVIFDDGHVWNLHRQYSMASLSDKAKRALIFIQKKYPSDTE